MNQTLKRGLQLLLTFVLSGALGAQAAQVLPSEVLPPNGTFGHEDIDLAVQTSAGELDWSRAWTGSHWRFNRQWDGISASYKPVATQATGGGVALAGSASSGDDAGGCWIWVEDGDGGDSGGNAVLVPTTPTATRLFFGTDYSLFNKSYSQEAFPLSTLGLSCVGGGGSSGLAVSGSTDVLEGYRRLASLYVGSNGTYIFKNRYILKKQTALVLPGSGTGLGGTPRSDDVAVASARSVDGWRWQDKNGDWIEYDAGGLISRYGDRNNNAVWLQRNSDGGVERMIDVPNGATSGHTVMTLQYNAAGDLVEVKDYPQAGNPLDLPQRRVQYQYGAAGELQQVTDPLGHVTKYAYDAKWRLTGITDPLNHSTTLGYDGDSTNVTKMTLPDGAATTYDFSYDDAQKQFYGHITGPMTDAGQRTQAFVHDRAGDLVEYDINGQPQITVKHDPAARTEMRTNARGFTTTLTKNEFEQVTKTLNADGTSTSTQYESVFLNPVKYTDEAGVITQYSYDARGNLVQSVQALGTPDQVTIKYEVDGNGRITKVTQVGRVEVNGATTADAVWQFGWNADGQLAQSTDPENGVRHYSFDRAGNFASYTDPLGHTSTYAADANGNLKQLTDGLGRTWKFEYDDAGNLLTATDARQKRIQSTWDEMNRSLTATNSVGGTTHTVYNAEGLPVSDTDEDGRTIQRQFDAFLRLTKQVDALNNATQYSYQIADGSQAGQLGTLGGPTLTQYPTYSAQTRYDERERPTARTILNPTSTGVESLLSTNAYDARGDLKSETDANGKTVTYARNALGQITTYTDSLGHQTIASYDARGNMIRLVDANNHANTFVYDRNDNVIQETLPLGQSTHYTWDAAGNMASKTDPNGNKSVYNYDAANRVSSVQYYNSANALALTRTFTWDAADNLTGWSEADALTGQTVSTIATFDDASRKQTETVTYPNPAGGTYSLHYGYGYSLAGYKTGITWPDDTQLTYGYAAQGEMQSVTIPGEGTISVDSFSWLAPTSVTLPGGTVETAIYDGTLKQRSLSVRNPAQQTTLALQNSYGKLQELSQIQRTDTSGGNSSTQNASYTYDSELQLTQASTDRGGLFGTDTETFTLDAVGNRVAHSRVAGAWTYDANNRLLQRGTGANATTYGYDSAGNMTSQSSAGHVLNYDYDVRNRLIRVRDGSNVLIARYGYDSFDRRAWKEQYRDQTGAALNPAIRTYYLYGDEGLLAEATQQIGLANDGSVLATAQPTVSTEYGVQPDSDFGSDVLFIKTLNAAGQSVVGYYHRDHLGTPLQATDKGGNVVWSGSYDPYGAAAITTPSATTTGITSNVRLAGQYYDAETGLHYNYRRYYDPSTGRYLTQDPVGMDGGINRFTFVGGSPTNFRDPSGRIIPLLIDFAAEMAICTGECMLADAAINAVTGECNNWGQSAKDCAIGCLAGFGLGKLFGKLFKASPCGANSFAAGTLVAVNDGAGIQYRKIEDIKVGDAVVSLDESALLGSQSVSTSIRTQRVTDLFVGEGMKDVIVLTLTTGEVIQLTANHSVRTLDGWKDANVLSTSDQLLNSDGKAVSIQSVAPRSGFARVYNLEVANTHTFFVGQAGILVHNGFGSYTCHFTDGTKYHGKGDYARAEKSAAEKARDYGKTKDRIDWKGEANNRDSFKAEHARLDADGGPGNPNNLNKINSPGKKM